MSPRPHLPAGIPGWRRAVCLGCGQEVIPSRQAHAVIGGRRDGTQLLLFDAEPGRALATNDIDYSASDLLLLGATHRECAQTARQRLEAGAIALPEDLPMLAGSVADDDEVLRLDLPPQVNTCAFCGDPAAARGEHIWGKWFSKLLQSHGGFGPKKRDAIEVRARRAVCTHCNTTWMSELEDAVIPILTPMLVGGPYHVLTPSQQRALAIWAFKTALTISLLDEENRFIIAGYYQWFRQHREPPDSTRILIGAYRGRNAASAYFQPVRIKGAEDQPPTLFSATFVAHRVLFQVLGYFGTGPIRVTETNPHFAAATATIWPPQSEDIDWPRNNMCFNDEAVEDFARYGAGLDRAQAEQ